MQRSLFLFGLACLVGSHGGWAAAAPGTSPPIPILRSSGEGPKPDGSYNWSFETANGIKSEEEGRLKPGSEPGETIASVRGSYSYQADDGTPVEISYTADENGFRPQGAAIPQPPEIPPAILRALEWIAHHPEEDNL
ncbi:endocuticle structural glycoprotein ABD-4-like [Phymastichus coffea]|uniref:endocuticle structural glycoprotein ABD-4-like n=1 Tax=Phymastichus coffea TaxID=108790 RepID=UPI00273C0694|nr:endocuticle structural glycoprotein ABD-4-like [Phymastichus coffea]